MIRSIKYITLVAAVAHKVIVLLDLSSLNTDKFLLNAVSKENNKIVDTLNFRST